MRGLDIKPSGVLLVLPANCLKQLEIVKYNW